MRVLVTSAGTASAINVIKALRLWKENPIHILAVDADPMAPGLYLADEHVLVPKCVQTDYIPILLNLCLTHQIQALYPIYSQEIEVVAKSASQFVKQGIGLLVPTPEVVNLCNDKRRMYELASKLGISTPLFLSQEKDPQTFPVFAKPNTASGTTDARKIDDYKEWTYMKSKFPNLIYQEFIAGPEYTVDVLCDRDSNVVVASPRLRLATKAGQSVKGQTVAAPDLVKQCTHLCKKVEMVGPCNLQFIQRDKEFVFIELNPRYAAGGLMLTVHAGANLPGLALKLMLGEAVVSPPIHPDVTMLRYWEEIFMTGGNRL
jgi:carbamoyl-phosphate synthase large subunit